MRTLSGLFAIIVFGGLVASALAKPLTYNAELLAELPLWSPYGNGDIWGEGDKLVVALRDGGFAMVDVSDPANPEHLGTWNPGNVFVQDVKMKDDIVYASNEHHDPGNPAGVYIVDVSDPSNMTVLSVVVDTYTKFVHNVWVDDHGYLYTACEFVIDAIRIYDVSIPSAPEFVGQYIHPEVGGPNWVGIHDMMVEDDILYASWLEGGLVLLDVSDPSDPVELAIRNYPGSFTHNAWPTQDRRHVLTTDEVVGGLVRIWDVQDLDNIVEVATYTANEAAIVHNAHVKGDLAYVSFYEEGVRILDISDPTDPVEVAYHDTYTPDTQGEFNGNWGVWPYQSPASEPGVAEVIYLSDLQGKLVTVRLEGPRRARLEGRVTVGPAPGQGLGRADLVQMENGRAVEADGGGYYHLDTGAGAITLEVSGFGAVSEEASTTLAAHETGTLDVALDLAPDPDVVVVDGTGEVARIEAVLAWLEELELDAQTWNVAKGSPPAAQVAAYASRPAVLWLTGGNSETLTEADRDTVDIWLDSGHSILLSGDRVGDQLAGGSWLEERFGAEHVANLVNLPLLEGIPGDPITDGMSIQLETSGPLKQQSPGRVAGVNGGEPILVYATLDEIYGGVRRETASGRTVFLEFGVEGVRDVMGMTGPEEFLHRNLLYLGVGVGVEDGGGRTPTPGRLVLRQNAPNPFNPHTSIHFDLPQGEGGLVPVRLEIYDGAGRRIRTLVDRALGPGSHAVIWDGRGDTGHAMASGRYIYRLTTPDRVETRSMILVK